MKIQSRKEALMKIIYSNKKTEKLCNDYKKMVKELGSEVAKKLSDLLNALESFPTLFDIKGLPQYRLHPLGYDREYQYSLVIHKGYKWRLIVYPLDNQGNLLKEKSNETEMLSKAVMVDIIEVSEHYD